MVPEEALGSKTHKPANKPYLQGRETPSGKWHVSILPNGPPWFALICCCGRFELGRYNGKPLEEMRFKCLSRATIVSQPPKQLQVLGNTPTGGNLKTGSKLDKTRINATYENKRHIVP